ncbi:MAG: mechanosensitive ion channel family protein [Balneolaceae bacterium]
MFKTTQIQDNLQNWLAESPSYYSQIVESIVIIFVLLVLRWIILRIVNRRIKDLATQYSWRKNIGYTITFIGFLLIGRVWFEGMGSLATFLGLLSAGLAIALRDPVMDIAAWIFILWRKPFDVGDRVQVGDLKGDVIDIRLFKFSLLEIGNWVHADQSTGRVIHVPNHNVFSKAIANYTSDFDFIWNEIEVVVTFESNWQKAKELLEQICNDHLEDFVKDADEQVKRASRSYLIRYNYLTPIVYTEVVGIGVKLTIRYLSNARKRRSTSQALWEDILLIFSKHDDIDFAYYTVRIYQNQIEGKPLLKPESGDMK